MAIKLFSYASANAGSNPKATRTTRDLFDRLKGGKEMTDKKPRRRSEEPIGERPRRPWRDPDPEYRSRRRRPDPVEDDYDDELFDDECDDDERDGLFDVDDDEPTPPKKRRREPEPAPKPEAPKKPRTPDVEGPAPAEPAPKPETPPVPKFDPPRGATASAPAPANPFNFPAAAGRWSDEAVADHAPYIYRIYDRFGQSVEMQVMNAAEEPGYLMTQYVGELSRVREEKILRPCAPFWFFPDPTDPDDESFWENPMSLKTDARALRTMHAKTTDNDEFRRFCRFLVVDKDGAPLVKDGSYVEAEPDEAAAWRSKNPSVR